MEKAVAFIVSNKWNDFSDFINHGTHNGYVAIPPTNKYHGLSYSELYDIINVHGGLTYSEPVINGKKTFTAEIEYLPEYVGKRNYILTNAKFITDNTEIKDDWWIFGFDTFHYGDNPTDHDENFVINETKNLMNQLISE